jgi:hypothetical protein
MAECLAARFPPDDFAAALEASHHDLLVVEPGQFWASITRILLDHLLLTSSEETLARIAFVDLPPATTRFLGNCNGQVLVSRV